MKEGAKAKTFALSGSKRIALVCAGIVVMVAGLIASTGLFEARTIPDVSATTLSGDQIEFGSLNGSVVLVNFWATTCAICVREMPKFAALFEKYQSRGFRTLAVAMPYDPPHRVIDYVAKTSLPFDVVLDIDGSVLRAFADVPGTPTSFLVDRRGRVVGKYLGEPDFEELESRIKVALNKQ